MMVDNVRKEPPSFVEPICPATNEPCETPLLCRLFGELQRCDAEHVRQKQEDEQ